MCAQGKPNFTQAQGLKTTEEKKKKKTRLGSLVLYWSDLFDQFSVGTVYWYIWLFMSLI